MALEEFSIPSHVLKYLEDQGYTVSNSMDSFISQWWQWYTGEDKWYDVEYVTLENRKKTRKRLSLHPARRVAREWSSLLLNEDTEASVDAEKANTYLNGYDIDDGSGNSKHVKGYLARHAFWMISQDLIEETFALGTGAWALWFDVRESDTVIKPRTYDARMVKPLSWDDDGITECAFCTRIALKGELADQLQMHVIGDGGTYIIKTVVFMNGNKVNAEQYGIIEEFDTGCPTPTFAVVRPGIKNTCVDVSPYGVSVFGDAIDAVKAVDLTWDALIQEIELTEAMVFLDESLIDLRDENGKMVPVPKGDGDRKFRKLSGQGASELYEVYSPAIRSGEQFKAFNTALAMLGDQCGFGQNYFTLEKGSGMKTATEVSSDNSQLMRSIHKHEVIISDALSQLLTALLTCARIHCGADIEEDFGDIDIFFDDSIITDTQTDKTMMMSEVAAGIVPKWMYLKEFYGMTDEEAKALDAPEVVDEGF